MTSPDLVGYSDLQLDRSVAADFIAGALAVLTERLPAVVWREGHTEVVLVEAMALFGDELVFALNRLVPGLYEQLLDAFGLVRDPGALAVAGLTVTAGDALGHVVPAGTRALLELGPGLAPVIFATDTPLQFAAGELVKQVQATATVAGAFPNGAAAGGRLSLVDAIAYVDRVVLATAVAGGRDREATAVFYDRGRTRFARLVETLVQPQHFAFAALEDPAVTRALGIDNYDPASGAGVGQSPGHVTVALAGPGGAALPPATAAALLARLSGQAQANLAVHLAAPTVTAVNVSATVRRLPGAVDAEIRAAAAAALTAYLSPDTWPWGAVVRRYELIPLLDQLPGVDFVIDNGLTVPAADVALPGAAPLARLGALDLTIQAPP